VPHAYRDVTFCTVELFIPFAITRYENSQIEGYLDFFPIVYYRTPPKSLGAPIAPSTALGNPGFAFRVILPAFLGRFLGEKRLLNAKSEEKTGK
jgi:hypothetical protein